MPDNVLSGTIEIDLDVVPDREVLLETLAHAVWELAQELIAEYDKRNECPPEKVN